LYLCLKVLNNKPKIVKFNINIIIDCEMMHKDQILKNFGAYRTHFNFDSGYDEKKRMIVHNIELEFLSSSMI